MSDTINRKDAIDTFLAKLTERERKNLLHMWSTVEVKYFTAKILEQLPSAQPRKTGKWISEVKGKKAIIDEYGNVTCSAHCSECGDWLTGSDEYACRGRYCPSCGARMDGEIDE